MIYFIQREDNGYIKIGYSKDVPTRMLSLRMYTRLTLLGQCEGDVEFEQGLHRKFNKFRVHGEWFHPSPGILDFIAQNTVPGDVKSVSAKKRGATKGRKPIQIPSQSSAIINHVPGMLAGKNLLEVSFKTGLSYSTVSHWAAGEVNRIDYHALIAWCKYFKCQPGDLFEYKE